MNCGFSGIEWTDYLDQALAFRDRQKIDAHLRVCAHCRSELEALRQIDQRLRIECGLIRQTLGAPDASAQERVLATLRQAVPHTPGHRSQERLWRVRWVLALLCGSVTATRIIASAQTHAAVTPDTDPSEQKWLLFLRRLSFLTTEICGSCAGDLIWAVGQ